MRKTLVLLLLILPLTWNLAAGANIFSQDFESVWDLNTPPTGWTILDLGSEGQQNWFTQDWFKYYFVQWGDTVFAIKVNFQKIENAYDEWLITPDISLPGGATACSLTFDTYYFDGSSLATGDSAFTMVSADGGAHWTTLMTYGSNLGSTSLPWYENIDVSSYIGQTIRFAFNLKTHGTTSHSAANTWIIDNVAVWTDASVLFSHDANGWGPWGDNPPAGWTIYDYGNPIPAQGSPNNNDWYQYNHFGWSSNAARVYWINNYLEWENEWMISPTFSIGAGNACTLSFAQYYNHVPTTPYDYDHGYVWLSTDGGHSWPYTIQDLTETSGDLYSKVVVQYDLGSFAGESDLKIAFNFVNAPPQGDWWMIDDISVDEYVPPTQDPSVASIDAPPDIIFTGANYTFTATIENAGPDSTIIDSVLFRVDNDEAPEVVFYDMIYPAVYLQGYANQQFNSSIQWNPAVSGNYIATVTVYGSGDENPQNNSYVSNRFAQNTFVYPFLENFESDLITDISQWAALGEKFGTTSNAHSPVTALWFDDDAVYPADRIAVSPPIYVSGSVDPQLKFWERSADAYGPQGQEVHTVGLMPGEWDLHNFVILFQEDTSSTTLEDSLWRESIVDAGDIEGDTVRVVIWYHCGDFPDRSWYVDDVALAEPYPVGRCCYPGEDLLCADNTEPECTALAGTWDRDLNCRDNPCPIIGTVAGQVTDSITTSPIQGAIVTASSDIEDIIVDTTDVSGNYSIDITPGPMTVTVEADGYVPDTNQVIVYQGQTTIHDVALAPVPVGRCCYPGDELLCADNTEPECIALSGTWDPDLNCRDNPCPNIGTVAGQVTDANTTSPIEGAIVTASSDEEDIIVDTTDASGNYSIDITAGPMTVTVEAAGYVPDTNQVIVYQGQTTTHNVALTAPMATIDTSPIYRPVDIGDTALYSRFLYNTGTAGLNYDVTLEEPEGAPALLSVNVSLKNEGAADNADPKLNKATPLLNVSKQPLPVILEITWMTVVSGQAGSIVPGDSAEIVFMVDFRDMSIVPDSTYSADAMINNNDPYSIPVISFHIQAVEPVGRCCYDDTLCADNTIPECFVLGGDWNPDLNCRDNPCPPPSCDYVVGDVNASYSYNGLDITYGVAFFKGGNEPLCEDCSLCPDFWYCGDVNASCSYNGLDITYGVAYLKGGPGLQPCADCPPLE